MHNERFSCKSEQSLHGAMVSGFMSLSFVSLVRLVGFSSLLFCSSRRDEDKLKKIQIVVATREDHILVEAVIQK